MAGREGGIYSGTGLAVGLAQLFAPKALFSRISLTIEIGSNYIARSGFKGIGESARDVGTDVPAVELSAWLFYGVGFLWAPTLLIEISPQLLFNTIALAPAPPCVDPR